MIISLDWLKEFADIQESPNELADLLSGIGLEAEATSVPTEISGVVIGKVETAEKHPDADKLKLCTSPFPRISYTECIKILNDSGNKIKWGEDFGSPEETYIAEQFDKPVIVYGFPSEIKAFYMKRDSENKDIVLGMDILAPEGYGEIVGGSERETDLDILLERIKNEKLNQADYEWFLDLRKYGSVPHSGFGMGLERVVAWICGLSHIRETIPFARTMTRINP